MENNFFELMQEKKKQNELATIISVNEKTQYFGLELSRQNAEELVAYRNESLKKYQRVEFGKGILDKLIFTFCDSQYIYQDNYLDTLGQLQDIFYEFKNAAEDKLTDEELLTFMREQFESVCYGDTEYLENTCLARFVKAIRSGYEGYKGTGGRGEYEKFDEEPRWDSELYLEVLKEQFWG